MKHIVKPTLLLNKDRAIHNLDRMVKKAQNSSVRFRPHFKTHQSAQIGEWYRSYGVTAITVSSFDMADYFAQHGWKDITVAFPVNIREIKKINQLAGAITLHLLVESDEVVKFLGKYLDHRVNVWIKIDVGYARAGIAWDDAATIVALAKSIQKTRPLSFQGLLTHAGQTYKARSKEEIQAIYTTTVASMNTVRERLQQAGFSNVAISIGDTPGCSVVERFQHVDEIRPGNFVFYDVMQLNIGSCSEAEIALALACPVVAKHPERHEIVMYGGAVHLSKDMLVREDGTRLFGYVVLPDEEYGWGAIMPHTYVSSISQEHGIVKTDEALFQRVNVGDVLMVLPVHACLTANLLRKYLTLEGETIECASRI